jgi:hypothetical protein
MPKPLKKPATVAPAPATDFAAQGLALALADLAQAKGLTVAGVCELPDALSAAGLPVPVPPHVAHAAHKIDRDRIDGMLWRCHGRRTSEPIPVVPRAQAEKIVESATTFAKTGTVTVTAPDAENLV